MCVELGGDVRSVLDRSELEEVRLHQPRCQMLLLSVYEGTWIHSPPLIAMYLLDISCVSVGFFLKLHVMFPNIMLRPKSFLLSLCIPGLFRVPPLLSSNSFGLPRSLPRSRSFSSRPLGVGCPLQTRFEKGTALARLLVSSARCRRTLTISFLAVLWPS